MAARALNRRPRPTAKYITTILLSHGHTVYSLIRNTSQIPEIRFPADPFPKAELIPLVHDLNGISTHEAARAKDNIPRHPQDQLSVERDAAMLFSGQARGRELVLGLKDLSSSVNVSAETNRRQGGVQRLLNIIRELKMRPCRPEARNKVTSYICRGEDGRQAMLVEEYRGGLKVDEDDSEEGCFSAVSRRAKRYPRDGEV
ncbi:hypothetical protein BGX38DRAFT_1264837 [Terfezia claveryi]|nr:hypothetical protein BGX38DRAFT_1264837 [Terfezia claveryi]